MSSMRQSASGGIGKFILFGLLVLAAGGLVFSDVGGFFRGGVSGSDIARVGDKTISIQQFDQTLRRTIARIGISPEQAYQYGYTREILNSEIRGEIMDRAAAENDIKVSKKHIAKQIHKIVAPMVQDGQTAEEVLNQLLRSRGMNEKQLVIDMRKDLSINLLNDSLKNGFSGVSRAIEGDMAAFENETRTIKYIFFADKDFKDIAAPTDEALEQLYAATKEAYAIPQTRQVQLVTIKTKDLEKKLDISDEEIRAEYDDNIDSYKIPENRMVEQVILRTASDAQKVIDKMNAGSSLKTAVKTVTGNITDYIPPSPVTKDNILEELRNAVFTADKGNKIGPIKTALGHHVLVLNNLEEAYTESFDNVKAAIRKEIVSIRLTDTKYELAGTVDDMLASGATPEDLAGEVDVDIKSLPATNLYGQTIDGKDAFEGMEDDKTKFLEIAFDLEEGESSAVFETADGNMGTLYLQNITAKVYPPFEDVKDTLKTRWVEDQRRANNKTATMEHFSAMEDEGLTLTALGKKLGDKVQTQKEIVRNATPPAPLTPGALTALFKTPLGKPLLLNLDTGTAIALVTANDLPTPSQDKEAQDKLRKTLIENGQNEVLSLFIDRQNQRYDAQINDRLLEQVYGSSQQ